MGAIRLGTRGSQLARWQAEWVAAELRTLGHDVELIEIVTHGDIEQARPIETIGTLGVFTKEIQRALLAGTVDIGVHSLKDLPTEPVEGLAIAAVPARESVADVIVLPRLKVAEIQESGAIDSPPSDTSTPMGRLSRAILPQSARVGTSSLRRQAQLRHVRPDLRAEEIRGNVDTRLRKLDEGQFDAIVLAEAGLRRLGLTDRITHRLSVELMLPAVGQGALGIECRSDDANILAVLSPLDDLATRAAVTAERALLARLRGGCTAPVGAWGTVVGGQVYLEAVVLSVDGTQRICVSGNALLPDALALGERLADELTAQGADQLIADARRPY